MKNIVRTDLMRSLPNKVAVLGAAKSGIASARFLLSKGCSVLISDSCTKEKLELILATNNIVGVESEFGGHSKKILECELIIVSPGIPSDIPILKKAKAKGIPVWSEIELAYRHSTAPFIAVTGSSGKSTTVSLLGEIFSAAGVENVVAGNIGTPLIAVAPEISADGIVVAEVSSFQLENIDQFQPSVAVVLNMTKNHLDRYKSEDDYYNAKKEIIKNMDDSGVLIINSDDEILEKWRSELSDINILTFGKNLTAANFVAEGEKILINESSTQRELATLSDIKIKGEHNISNATVATAVALNVGVEIDKIIEGISNFNGLTHRIEYIRTVNDVEYYNDSKSTTAESVKVAVEAFSVEIHLIVGGKDKGGDFESIKDSIRSNVRTVALIGEASERIGKAWENCAEINYVETLDAAVDCCKKNAKNGEIILLSPGCSSFDMFDNFEHRGDEFRRLVEDL